MDKVKITITTDKPVKISVTHDDSAAGKEAEGIKRLIRHVEEEDCDVVRQRETRSGSKG